jgi:DNA-binding ferritin-like protein
MENLRREKQAEFMDSFQAHQQLMCENLQQHMQTAVSDEDRRIAEVVQEKLAKRDVREWLLVA